MKLVFDKSYTLLLILVLALGLRFTVIDQSLWLDEAIGALAVRDYSYSEILSEYIKADFHPPLYYLLHKFWTSIFGYTEFALRSLSVFLGVGTVYLTYLIAGKLSGGKKSISTTAALLLATSQFHIYYSQEARMYAMAAFLAALSVYSFIQVSHRSKKHKNIHLWWVLFSFSLTTLIFTDYVPIFLFPVFWIYAIVVKKSLDWWKRFLLSHLPVVVLGVVWLPTFLIQVENGNWLMSTLPAWKLVGGTNIKQTALIWMKFVFGRISFPNKLFYYSLVGLSSAPFALLLIKSFNNRKKTLIVWMWLVVPLLLGFATSFWFPAFVYFRFLYVLPALYLLIAHGVGKIKNGKLQAMLILTLILINLLGLGVYYLDQNQQREQWRQAIALIERDARENDIVIFEYPQPFSPYRWYATGNLKAVGVTDSISANYKKTREKTLENLEDANGVYYFEYLRDLSDPERIVEETLSQNGFEMKEVVGDFPGLGQISYWAKGINE